MREGRQRLKALTEIPQPGVSCDAAATALSPSAVWRAVVGHTLLPGLCGGKSDGVAGVFTPSPSLLPLHVY